MNNKFMNMQDELNTKKLKGISNNAKKLYDKHDIINLETP